MNVPIQISALVACVALMSSAHTGLSSDLDIERLNVAERYFRGIYSGDTTVVDDLAGADIVVSYPLFEKLFGVSAIRGRESVKAFVTRFGQRWADPQFEFHEAVSDGDIVVLVWSFRARSIAPSSTGEPPSNEEHAWGGITLIRFDEDGRISAEIGEESEPGPIERLHGGEEN